MLASGELPDMLEYNFFNFPGGPEKAIKDGYILELNDLIDKYAPNYKKYLQEHPEVEKMVKTDKGSYYSFPFIRGDESLLTFQGPVIRKDWLDELGLPVPETIDEWTTALKAFKEKKGLLHRSPSSPNRVYSMNWAMALSSGRLALPATSIWRTGRLNSVRQNLVIKTS